MADIPWKDRLLFTPGPLTTSPEVKAAMLRDLGSRDGEFIRTVAEIRRELLRLLGLDAAAYTVVPLQGSGSMAVEAVLGTAVPRDGGLLVAANGAYGRRMLDMAGRAGIAARELSFPEDEAVDPDAVERCLAADGKITHVAAVHCETTSGIMNPVDRIGTAVRRNGRSFIVDAMSSLGAAPIDMDAWGVDWLAASANKCLESVPGLALTVVSRAALAKCRGNARGLTLDLHDQNEYMDKCGQFRFTPPVQVVLALRQALRELAAEGGVTARRERYRDNCLTLRQGMAELGFRGYLPSGVQGWSIVSFFYPEQPAFSFEKFYELLHRDGFVIYPGKVAAANLFRIGCIGRLDRADMKNLLAAVKRAAAEMGLDLSPLPPPA